MIFIYLLFFFIGRKVDISEERRRRSEWKSTSVNVSNLGYFFIYILSLIGENKNEVNVKLLSLLFIMYRHTKKALGEL